MESGIDDICMMGVVLVYVIFSVSSSERYDG